MYRGVLRVELGGDIGIRDGGVVVGEVVALEAERADPDERSEVDAAEGVEHHRAGLAPQRRVGERRDLVVRPDRGNRGGDWDHALARLHLRPGPHVPRHPNPVDPLRIHVRHLRRH